MYAVIKTGGKQYKVQEGTVLEVEKLAADVDSDVELTDVLMIIDGDKVEVRPHYKELNKKYAKESGQEFFRISLDGKINLFGTDYEIVSQSNIEDQLVFIIDKSWSYIIVLSVR